MKKSLKILLGTISASPLLAVPLVAVSCKTTTTEFEFQDSLKVKKPSEIKAEDFTVPTGATDVKLTPSDSLGVLSISYKLNNETKTHLITGFEGTVKKAIEELDKVNGKLWGEKITVPKDAADRFDHYMGRGFLQVEGSYKEEDNGKMKLKIKDKEFKQIADPVVKFPKALTVGSPKDGAAGEFNASVSVKNSATYKTDKKIVCEYSLVLYFGGQKTAIKTYTVEISYEIGQ